MIQMGTNDVQRERDYSGVGISVDHIFNLIIFKLHIYISMRGDSETLCLNKPFTVFTTFIILMNAKFLMCAV